MIGHTPMFEHRKQYLRTLADNAEDEELIKSAIACLEGFSQPEKSKQTKTSRMKSSGNLYRQAIAEGIAMVPVQIERFEKLGGYVPGKSDEERIEWFRRQLNKSKTVYREYPDGAWGLRRSS